MRPYAVVASSATSWQRVVSAVICFGILGLIYAAMGADRALQRPQNQVGFAMIFAAVWWVLSAVISASAISQEKESDTWILLLATPMSGRQIVWGKFLAALSFLSVLNALTLYMPLLVWWHGKIAWGRSDVSGDPLGHPCPLHQRRQTLQGEVQQLPELLGRLTAESHPALQQFLGLHHVEVRLHPALHLGDQEVVQRRDIGQA